jgi:hypothetical protein
MAHYAIINENNFVIFVHVGKDESDIVLDNNGNKINWETYYNAKRTSYNTLGGLHYTNGELSQDQSKAFRKNYAGVGYYYDSIRDAFIPPKPYPSWILNEDSCLWEAPIPYPNDGNTYQWNEETGDWELNNDFNIN